MSSLFTSIQYIFISIAFMSVAYCFIYSFSILIELYKYRSCTRLHTQILKFRNYISWSILAMIFEIVLSGFYMVSEPKVEPVLDILFSIGHCIPFVIIFIYTRLTWHKFRNLLISRSLNNHENI